MKPKKAEALNCIRAAITALDEEIQKPEVARVADLHTLSEFRMLLKKMHEDVELDALSVPEVKRGGMGRVIADSWPWSSVVGDLVIKAENAFLELRF